MKYTQECAKESPFAQKVLKDFYRSHNTAPSSQHFFFKEYNFATVGKRDAEGNFISREKFYSLSKDFSDELSNRLEAHLCSWAEDLFNY